MVVSNLLFDALLFGVMLVAMVADGLVPALHGVATLLVVGTASYMAAQEISEALAKRGIWTQESLTTAIALSTGGFIYYWWRNDSDLALLILSIGLMMASLMVAIGIIAACGASLRSQSPGPLCGLILTVAGALLLGILASLLTLTLNGAGLQGAGARANGPAAPPPVGIEWWKIAVVIVGLALWKMREKLRPPAPTPGSGVPASAEGGSAPVDAVALPAAATWLLAPQRGTLLDRFLPVILLGGLLFVAMQQKGNAVLGNITPTAAAQSSGTAPGSGK